MNTAVGISMKLCGTGMRTALAVLALFLGLLPVAGAPAADSTKMSINLNGVTLNSLVTYLSKLESKPVILDAAFQSIKNEAVSVVSTQNASVTGDELWQIVKSILQSRGYAIINDPAYLQIVPLTSARSMAEPATNKTTGSSSQFITKIVTLRYATADATVKALDNHRSAEGKLIATGNANQIIITDYAPTVKRLEDIISEIDVAPARPETEYIKLQSIQAANIAPIIDDYIRSLTGITPGVKQGAAGADTADRNTTVRYTLDTRSNSVMVMGMRAEVDKVAELVRRVDSAEQAEGNIHVYPLRYSSPEAVAESIEPMLTGIMEKSVGKDGSKKSSNLRIVADKERNALVISATPEEFRQLRLILDSLDQPKKQVHIEVAIVEMTDEKLHALGAQWGYLDNPGSGNLGPFGYLNSGVASASVVNGQYNVTPSMTTGTLSLGAMWQDIFNIPLLIQLSQKDSDIDILAKPTLTADNHSSAEIKITDKSPYATSTTADSGNTSLSRGGVDEAGNILRLIPHVSDDNMIRMEVHQITSEFGDEVKATNEKGAVVPIGKNTFERESKSELTILSGRTAVIGGLTREKITQSEDGVPGLSKVPYIGSAFRNKKLTKKKINLCIFICAKVITNQDEFNDRSKKKFEMMRDSLGNNKAKIYNNKDTHTDKDQDDTIGYNVFPNDPLDARKSFGLGASDKKANPFKNQGRNSAVSSDGPTSEVRPAQSRRKTVAPELPEMPAAPIAAGTPPAQAAQGVDPEYRAPIVSRQSAVVPEKSLSVQDGEIRIVEPVTADRLPGGETTARKSVSASSSTTAGMAESDLKSLNELKPGQTYSASEVANLSFGDSKPLGQ